MANSSIAHPLPLKKARHARCWPSNGLHAEYDALHSGGATKLFCDGHARWGRNEALRSGEFGLLTDVPVINKDYGFVYKGAF